MKFYVALTSDSEDRFLSEHSSSENFEYTCLDFHPSTMKESIIDFINDKSRQDMNYVTHNMIALDNVPPDMIYIIDDEDVSHVERLVDLYAYKDKMYCYSVQLILMNAHNMKEMYCSHDF